MPCYIVQTISVKFSAKSIESLTIAIERLNWTQSPLFSNQNDGIVAKTPYGNIQLDFLKEEASFSSNLQGSFNEMKRKYSEVVLEKIAKKKRWVLKKKNNVNFELKRC